MNLSPYRLLLRLPGMRGLILVGFVARIPVTMAGLAVTLHVVTTLGLGYGRAGLAGALAMAGAAVGGPLVGRMVDRFGARPVIATATVAQAVYWSVAPSLGYTALLGAACVAGFLNIPIFSVMRQFLAALAPPSRRRTAFALDSMTIELSYMVGPALAVAGVTLVGSVATMYAVGAGVVASGAALCWLNPPTRSADEARDDVAVPRRQWLTPGLGVVLLATAGALFVLAASELTIVASLRESGATAWTGLVIGLWCAYSLIGGFVYGAMHRAVSPLYIIGGLGALTIPVGLFGGSWWWLALALLPSGILCSPALASTVDAVSSRVPANARGEAMGLHGTALTIGVAAGAPVAGAVIDAFGPTWGFAVAGGVGLLVTTLAAAFWPRTVPASPPPRSPSRPPRSPRRPPCRWPQRRSRAYTREWISISHV